MPLCEQWARKVMKTNSFYFSFMQRTLAGFLFQLGCIVYCCLAFCYCCYRPPFVARLRDSIRRSIWRIWCNLRQSSCSFTAWWKRMGKKRMIKFKWNPFAAQITTCVVGACYTYTTRLCAYRRSSIVSIHKISPSDAMANRHKIKCAPFQRLYIIADWSMHRLCGNFSMKFRLHIHDFTRNQFDDIQRSQLFGDICDAIFRCVILSYRKISRNIS